jgi:hypothetical protein
MLEQVIDVDAMLKRVASETVVKGENLRANVRDLTLRALQSRELTLIQIKQVLKSVSLGVNAGAAKAGIDVEKPLADALAGMDDALLKAIRASQMALEQLLDHGADFEDSNIRKALDELNDLEEEFLDVVKDCAASANKEVKAQWAGVFAHLPPGGIGVGAQAEAAAAKIALQTRTAIRNQREGAARFNHQLLQNYGTLASGILIGLSEGLGGVGVPAKAAEPTKSAASKAKPAKARSAKNTRR